MNYKYFLVIISIILSCNAYSMQQKPSFISQIIENYKKEINSEENLSILTAYAKYQNNRLTQVMQSLNQTGLPLDKRNKLIQERNRLLRSLNNFIKLVSNNESEEGAKKVVDLISNKQKGSMLPFAILNALKIYKSEGCGKKRKQICFNTLKGYIQNQSDAIAKLEKQLSEKDLSASEVFNVRKNIAKIKRLFNVLIKTMEQSDSLLLEEINQAIKLEEEEGRTPNTLDHIQEVDEEKEATIL